MEWKSCRKIVFAIILIIVFASMAITLFIQNEKIQKMENDVDDFFGVNGCVVLADGNYISKTEHDFVSHMATNGWIYLETERAGACYYFQKGSKKICFEYEHHYYYAKWLKADEWDITNFIED